MDITTEENNTGLSALMDEAGRGYRTKKRQMDPIYCPVCSLTLRHSEINIHLKSEINKLEKLQVPKMKFNGKNIPSSSAVTNSKTKHYESFQKVRRNRENRQRSKWNKRKSEEKVICPICNKSNFDDPDTHVELCLRNSQECDESDHDDYENNIDIESFEEYEWAGQSRIRATSLLPPGGVSSLGTSLQKCDDNDEDLNVDGDDGDVYGSPQYTERDIIHSCEDTITEDLELRKAVFGIDENNEENSEESYDTPEKFTESKGDPVLEVLKKRIKELEARLNNSAQDDDTHKCLICMERYRTPVISVSCWHVYCEQCWLKTLGAKKLCPQCNIITSAADLRKIYM